MVEACTFCMISPGRANQPLAELRGVDCRHQALLFFFDDIFLRSFDI